MPGTEGRDQYIYFVLSHMYYFTFPRAVHKGSNFSTSLPKLVNFYLFYNNHPSGYEVVSNCGLICISPVVSDVEHS